MANLLRVQLEGGPARLGDVPAADVARLILGVQSAVARAAVQELGRRPAVGRRSAPVEATTRLRLVGLSSGSVVVELRLPHAETEGQLEIDTPHLGELALERTIDLIAGSQKAEQRDDVVAALDDLSRQLGVGSRYDSVKFSYEGLHQTTSAVLDSQRRDALHALRVGPSPERSDTVSGTLVEADFEKSTARLRLPDGSDVNVSFSETLADDIYAALRRPAQLAGHVRFDPRDGSAVAVTVESIVQARRFFADEVSEEFWRVWNITQLAEEQHVTPIADLAEIRDTEATDEEIDALFEALGI